MCAFSVRWKKWMYRRLTLVVLALAFSSAWKENRSQCNLQLPTKVKEHSSPQTHAIRKFNTLQSQILNIADKYYPFKQVMPMECHFWQLWMYHILLWQKPYISLAYQFLLNSLVYNEILSYAYMWVFWILTLHIMISSFDFSIILDKKIYTTHFHYFSATSQSSLSLTSREKLITCFTTTTMVAIQI